MGKLMLDGVEVGLPDRTVTAGGVSYDNTTSGLSATECQSAIDELAGKLKVKTITLTNTSTTSGGIYLSDLDGGKNIIVSSRILGVVGSNNHLFMPIWSLSQGNKMIAKFLDMNAGSLVNYDTTLNGTISYITIT